MPIFAAAEIAPLLRGDYPPEFADKCWGSGENTWSRPCAVRSLVANSGLGVLGVNLTLLAPGAWSALRHWHVHKDDDELILPLSPLTLVTNAGESAVGPGTVCAFKGGVPDAHHFKNTASEPAVLLEIGVVGAALARVQVDATSPVARYPDDDMEVIPGVDGPTWRRPSDGGMYSRGHTTPIQPAHHTRPDQVALPEEWASALNLPELLQVADFDEKTGLTKEGIFSDRVTFRMDEVSAGSPISSCKSIVGWTIHALSDVLVLMQRIMLADRPA